MSTLCVNSACENYSGGRCNLTVCKNITDYNTRMELLNSNTDIYIIGRNRYTNLSTIATDLDLDERELRRLIGEGKGLKAAIAICQKHREEFLKQLKFKNVDSLVESKKQETDAEIAAKRAKMAEEELSLDDIIKNAKTDDEMDEP